jgi:1-acyl-sn-glycerol-3-phosphate acyltransferase
MTEFSSQRKRSEAMKKPDQQPEVLRRYSPRLARGFARWLRGYFRRNFDGVRTSLEGAPPEVEDAPLIVYTNHPSWWDPVHFLLLARSVMPGRRMFGPFDAAALAKYPLFGRLGAFGIDRSTRRGALEFLTTSRAILAAPETTLWITAQGEFSDPRYRPVALQPGLAHLIRKLDRGLVVPLAVEYPLWNERRPEALSRFGRPIDIGDARQRTVEDLNALLVERLTETMDALAEDAVTRDPARFRTLLLGRTGVGGVYDMGRRFRAWIRGRRFDSAHEGDRQ